MSGKIANIGIIGAGPMATYALKELLQTAERLQITVFESAPSPGCGMPYCRGVNSDWMYCNAFSREIPAITRKFADWLHEQDESFLAAWDLKRSDIDAREFYPRVLLGEYLKSEFFALCDQGRRDGHTFTVMTDTKVMDITLSDGLFVCRTEADGKRQSFPFQHLILATGHDWPRKPNIDNANLISPWPYSNITELPQKRIGILGSSLSAIDAVVTLGKEHGTFVEEGGTITWAPNESSKDLAITMVSHRGIMPEPDFYYIFPYEPLIHINEEAVMREIKQGSSGLLVRVFELLIAELNEVAPDYLAQLGDDAKTIAGFGDSYFQHRENLGGLRALEKALTSAERSVTEKVTQHHRYALLRAHENFALILEHLDESDWQIFMDHLMPVFADCYAAVPHISVRRILALYNAGVLDILSTDSDSRFEKAGANGVTAMTENGKVTFDAMIDSRGQSSASLAQLPFPGLTRLIAQPDEPVREPYILTLVTKTKGSIYCISMPQVLERHPFSQGLPNCHEIGQMVAQGILKEIARDQQICRSQ